ncbi:hypothetical protein FBQ82_01470 [Anaerolineae bacterium CFX7]|nr:hypothetical protein [Anaerolineae bacterium CFX7]
MEYDILFYDSWQTPPVYYWLGTTRGRTPEDALLRYQDKLAAQLDQEFDFIVGDLSVEKIKRELYVVRPNGLCSLSEARRVAAKRPKRSGVTKRKKAR